MQVENHKAVLDDIIWMKSPYRPPYIPAKSTSACVLLCFYFLRTRPASHDGDHRLLDEDEVRRRRAEQFEGHQRGKTLFPFKVFVFLFIQHRGGFTRWGHDLGAEPWCPSFYSCLMSDCFCSGPCVCVCCSLQVGSTPDWKRNLRVSLKADRVQRRHPGTLCAHRPPSPQCPCQ